MDRDCACKGVGLLREMFDTICMQGSVAGNKKAVVVAQKIQTHLKEQVMKPGNESVHQELTESFDILRRQVNTMKFSDILESYPKGTLSPVGHLDTIRDLIHKSPALQRLMLCGSPAQATGDEEKMLARAFDLAGCVVNNDYGETGEIVDAIDELDKLSKKLNC